MNTRLLSIAGVLALSLALVGTASADAVSISTGIADWQVAAIPDGAPGDLGPAHVIASHPGWNHTLEVGNVSWIGASEDGASRGLAGDYVYELSMELAPGTYNLAAAFTSDNFTTSFKLNGAELLAAPQSDPYSFQSTFTVTDQTSTTPLNLQVVVHNDTYSVGMSLDNPTGLIVSGEVVAVPVPLPAAALAGLALLGSLGAMKTLRRKA